MKNHLIIALVIVSASLCYCDNTVKQKESAPQVTTAVASTGPDAVIYQTKANYNNLVPVILNDEKTQIVSFPAPGDLKYKGKLATPTILEGGYLLDNRGIDKNVAFLSITYEQYMNLAKAPSVDRLMHKIMDKDPLISMYNCGKRQLLNNEVDELNAYILENDFSKFAKLK
jgi:hypothetical protein